MKTVSIIIPVLNEEETIARVIKSCLRQKGQFNLENIYVICDGSTDKTPLIVKKIAQTQKMVSLVGDRRRLGKSARLIEAFKKNRSDYVVVFDGDVTITDVYLVNKLISQFNNPKRVLVSSNNQPLAGSTIFGKIVKAAEDLWYECRKDYHDGDNIFNNSGCGVALEKKFSKKLILPKGTIADQQFIYLSSKKLQGQFAFVKDAVVYYLPAQNWQDFLKQYRRSLHEDYQLEQTFGQKLAINHLPLITRVKGALMSLVKNPVFTILAICVLAVLPHLSLSGDPLTSQGSWERIDSSKSNL